MEFNIKLELVCIQRYNELGFKLIRIHIAKLCLIKLMMVIQSRELLKAYT